ncbi:MAG: hypothetical protein WAQ24_04235 [Candidatus Saccharimonadales bacterium]
MVRNRQSASGAKFERISRLSQEILSKSPQKTEGLLEIPEGTIGLRALLHVVQTECAFLSIAQEGDAHELMTRIGKITEFPLGRMFSSLSIGVIPSFEAVKVHRLCLKTEVSQDKDHTPDTVTLAHYEAAGKIGKMSVHSFSGTLIRVELGAPLDAPSPYPRQHITILPKNNNVNTSAQVTVLDPLGYCMEIIQALHEELPKPTR